VFLEHNTNRHPSSMPYRSRHFSVVEVAERRPVEAEAVVDSQADHRSPDMPAEAAADNTHPDRVNPQEDNTAVAADRSNLCLT